MTPDGFRRLLDGVPTLVKVKLQGVGEPFLSPHFFDLVEEATRRDIAPHTITNGTTLSERVVERIYASGLVEVAVSLDTPRKESFERIRAGADFDRVLAGVRRLCGHGLRRRLLVSVWATIWRDTVAETPELVRLAADLGVDSLFLNFSLWDWNDPGAARAVAGARPVGDDIYRESARRSREEAARSGLALVVLPPGAGAARSSILRCEWPWRSAFVTCDGHVTPCCKIARPADCSLGNAFTTPFRAIWNGPRYRAFRAAFLRGEPPAVCDAACSAGG